VIQRADNDFWPVSAVSLYDTTIVLLQAPSHATQPGPLLQKACDAPRGQRVVRATHEWPLPFSRQLNQAVEVGSVKGIIRALDRNVRIGSLGQVLRRDAPVVFAETQSAV